MSPRKRAPVQDLKAEIELFEAASMAHGLENYTEDDYLRFWRIAGLEKPKGRMEVFEAGCGSGAFGRRLAKLGYRVKGMDLSRTLVKKANELAKKEKVPYRAQVGDLYREARGRKRYDVVICPMVLHHFLDLNTIIPPLGNMLKPQGRLILIEPNGAQPVIALSEWVRRHVWPFSSMGELASPNETNHRPGEYKRALNRASLQVVKAESFESEQVAGDYGLALNILLALKKALMTFSSLFLPGLWSGSTLIMVAKRGRSAS